MKKIFLVIIFIVINSNLAFAISKKDAFYQKGDALHQYSHNYGEWVAWLSTCNGKGNSKFANDIRLKVGKLSWPDFKILNSAMTAWTQRYVAGKCKKSEITRAKGNLNTYIDELSIVVKNITNKTLANTSQNNDNEENKQTQKSNNQKNESEDSFEQKLEKLKSSYEKKLITKEEYDTQRKKILDEL